MIDPQSLVGREVDGRYRLASFLGDGAFGWVYAADEILMGEAIASCALKIVRPRGDAGRAGLMREIKAMAQLSHPRLIGFKTAGVLCSGDLNGNVYIAMELGQQSLADRLSRPEPMSADEVRQVAVHVLEALVYLHSQGAVHRDVKPANVFRVGDGWKLGDFGLVRSLEGSVVMGTGVKGTPLYMAPEVLDEQAGPPADVWALGVMVQECLTGTFPFTGDTEFALMKRLMTTAPQIPQLSAPFDSFVRQSLERDRKKRWTADSALAFLGRGGSEASAVGTSAGPTTTQVSAGSPKTTLVPSPSPAPSLPAGMRSLGKNAQGFEEAVNEKDGTVLIRISAGEFIMGSNEQEDEKPPHSVRLEGYWMARTTVTNAQFRRFVKATGHKSAGDWEKYARGWGDDCPVVEVSWHDAVAYCTWAGLRLPTEAEWEYAARGPQGLEYPWGSEWDASRCCSGVDDDLASVQGPVAVGSYPSGASPFGCLDLAGNVWEWCSSLYAPYPYRADDGRERASTEGDDTRVLRGGSWVGYVPRRFRGAGRGGYDPTYCNILRGFRSARTS